MASHVRKEIIHDSRQRLIDHGFQRHVRYALEIPYRITRTIERLNGAGDVP